MSKQEIDINLIIRIENSKNGTSEEVLVGEETQSDKLNVSLSVAQLAYLFRMLIELGIIKNKKISEVIRYVCGNISTPKAKEISFDSFKAKYYNVDNSTKEHMLKLLLDQINYIKKDLNR